MRHFALARRLLPDSAIARIEEANGLVMLFGKAKLAEAGKLYEEAALQAGRCRSSTPSTRREEAEG